MPGAVRPYTLVDVLGTLNDQSAYVDTTVVAGLGVLAEADETVATSDTVTATVAATATWDGGQWGSTTWS